MVGRSANRFRFAKPNVQQSYRFGIVFGELCKIAQRLNPRQAVSWHSPEILRTEDGREILTKMGNQYLERAKQLNPNISLDYAPRTR